MSILCLQNAHSRADVTTHSLILKSAASGGGRDYGSTWAYVNLSLCYSPPIRSLPDIKLDSFGLGLGFLALSFLFSPLPFFFFLFLHTLLFSSWPGSLFSLASGLPRFPLDFPFPHFIVLDPSSVFG